MAKTHWNYQLDDGSELFDGEFKTKDKAFEYARVQFDNDCAMDDEIQSAEMPISLIEMSVDEEGEERVVQTVQDMLKWNRYV